MGWGTKIITTLKKVPSFFSRGGGAAARNYDAWARPWRVQGVGDAAGKAGKAVAGAAGKAGAKVISWGSAAKVVLVGGVGYLLLSGGLSKTVSSIFGIPEWLAQMLVWIVVVVIFIWCLRYISRYVRGKVYGRNNYRRY